MINTWSEQAQKRNLPVYVQEALSNNRNLPTMRLMAALLRKDEDDDITTTEKELRHALPRSKATAPSDDGVTYGFVKVSRNIICALCITVSYF